MQEDFMTTTPPDFRDSMLAPDCQRILSARGLDPYTYSQPILATPRAQALNAEWQGRYNEPFKGVTADGVVRDGLFALQDEGFGVEAAVAAADRLLSRLTPDQAGRAAHAVDASEWRGWYNPEIMFNTHGVRLEETSAEAKSAFLDLLAACTSGPGFEKIRNLLSANLYLGEIYDLCNIMNEWSYHFLMFGAPSATTPWGWSIYGHHVGFNCFIIGRQIVISPTFMGVEPNVIDRGEDNCFALFTEEERLGLQLMQSLSPDLRSRATIFEDMEDPDMPAGRFNFADQRHLGGAFQDNRIIPLEGVAAAEFSPSQRAMLLSLIETFMSHVPDGPRAAQIKRIEAHLDETWWSWIGGCGDDDPFYFRIQSPLIMLEFDHHNGMWLTNEQPAKFHIHVITRIPNGNDYGKALLELYRARQVG
jgi:hypothetical protein